MNIVIVGHVDHGKSTLVGRLLADTGTISDVHVKKVQATCRRQGKRFEYAFLLDALEAEQEQGITIDAARVFFRSERRDYIIIDAPGHVEFLKNMVTGAARAESAVLLIDANEGVRENSRRHGYLLSMLGIRQIVVAVNKMDLVSYDRTTFLAIVEQYKAFLHELGVQTQHFVPISAREGDLIAKRSDAMAWYDGPTILEAIDGFTKRPPPIGQPLRMPVQDVYKFNVRGDDHRIIVGRVESGVLEVGDRVVFSPSNKSSIVRSIEAFVGDAPQRASAGQSTGVTMVEEIYVERGEIMSHVKDAPGVSTMLRANLFWLGRRPMELGRRYKLKLGTAETDVRIHAIQRVLDASALETRDKNNIERHDVAEVVLRTRTPIAFDPSHHIETTGRFVIVDGYDIAGGGIVRELVADDQQQERLETRIRDLDWVRGELTPGQRSDLIGHPATLVMITGNVGVGKHALARKLEVLLVRSNHHAYLLDGKNVVLGVDADIQLDDRAELVRRFGEVAHILLDAGLVVVSTVNVIGLGDHRTIATRITPFGMFVVHLGTAAAGLPEGADIRLNEKCDPVEGAEAIMVELAKRKRLRTGMRA